MPFEPAKAAEPASPHALGIRVRHTTDQNVWFDDVHITVYIQEMKKSELEKALMRLGWRFLRHGGRHDIWTDGERLEPIPRHSEINEKLARAVLRRARRGD